jgi:hypothetical protein
MTTMTTAPAGQWLDSCSVDARHAAGRHFIPRKPACRGIHHGTEECRPGLAEACGACSRWRAQHTWANSALWRGTANKILVHVRQALAIR